MPNTIEILYPSVDRIQTIIKTTDNVTVTENHRIGLQDSEVLQKLKEKKYYDRFPGDWIISIPGQYKTFRNEKRDAAIDMAIAYMYERDNPGYPEYFV